MRKKKLIITGIVLLAVLSGCSDRNEEDLAPQETKIKHLELSKKNSNKTDNTVYKTQNDSVNTHDELNESTYSRDESAVSDTVDPTKSDRPK